MSQQRHLFRHWTAPQKHAIRPSNSLSKIGANLLDTILPHYCPLCLNPSSTYICPHCEERFKRIDQCCQRCALPLHTTEPYCADCLNHGPSFDTCICAYEYRYPFNRVISLLKDKRDLDAAAAACDVLASAVTNRYQNRALPQCLIPVPMHWRRRWQRGFNQSEFICQRLSTHLKIPARSALQKIKMTDKQKSLSKNKRKRNLIGSFSANVAEIEGKHIALIDDVITTASTVSVLADLCIDAGARQVDVWALSRTPK